MQATMSPGLHGMLPFGPTEIFCSELGTLKYFPGRHRVRLHHENSALEALFFYGLSPQTNFASADVATRRRPAFWCIY
jgi:hypothetical protein